MALTRRLRFWTLMLVASTVLAGGSSAALTAQPTPPPLPSPPRAASSSLWWHDAVCYEVFVRSFADGDGDGIGDLDGLIDRLDYVNDGNPTGGDDLGATCIWLMPIFQATSYHGYDVEDYYRVEPDYGSNDDFKRLVAAAHDRGIRVVIDLVLNHTSRVHPWFRAALVNPTSPYRDWYIFAADDPGYAGPWGQPVWHDSPVRDESYYGIFWEGMPDLNYRNPAVTAEAREISEFWLSEMRVDGFRLDAIKHLIEDGRIQENAPETHAWLRDYRAFLDSTAPHALTVGENFGATASNLAPYFPDQLHTYFQFDIATNLLTAADYGSGGALLNAVEGSIAGLPDQRWATFLTNHDQTRTMTLLNGDVSRAKLAATALLTLPGLPFVYYGEEIGMQGDKPDERIRTPMQWSADPGGGFTNGVPWQDFQTDYREVNVAAQDADTNSLLAHYRRLIHLHTTHPALGHGDFLPIDSGQRAVSAFVRGIADETLIVLINFDDEAIDDAMLTGDALSLEPGVYDAATVFGDLPPVSLEVTADGRLAGADPLPTLSPLTGYVLQLSRAD